MLSLYNEHGNLQRRQKPQKLPKITIPYKIPYKNPYKIPCKNPRKIPRKIPTISSLPKLPPINMPPKKMYIPDIGRNALIKLCGYPPSTQNIDEMIANNHFIS